MPALPDRWIREMSRKHKMIAPFAEGKTRKGKISFGVSSYGYDFRLAGEYRIPDFSLLKTADPKNVDDAAFGDFKGRFCLIPPNSFILGRSLEYFRIPRDVITICQGKSTYARSGVLVNVTPLEPEWEGYITVAIVNTAPVPARVYSGEGIAQLVFIRAESECSASYADKKGKYQGQAGITAARVSR